MHRDETTDRLTVEITGNVSIFAAVAVLIGGQEGERGTGGDIAQGVALQKRVVSERAVDSDGHRPVGEVDAAGGFDSAGLESSVGNPANAIAAVVLFVADHQPGAHSAGRIQTFGGVAGSLAVCAADSVESGGGINRKGILVTELVFDSELDGELTGVVDGITGFGETGSGKTLPIWLMGYNAHPEDFKQIDKVVDMYEAAGVDRLATWTYRGGLGTSVAAPDPIKLWDAIGENYKRVLKK